MNTYEQLKEALENEWPVAAHVRLYNGEQRVRLGMVSTLTRDYVIIHDFIKGFRTTPINFVLNLEVQKPKRTLFGSIVKAFGEAMK